MSESQTLLTSILLGGVLISFALTAWGIIEFLTTSKMVNMFTESKEKEMNIVITEGHEFKFALGVEVRDVITGFEGVVTRRTQWLNNCNTYGVQPRKLKDGAIQECSNFDEPQLVLVPAVEPIQPSRSTGGPDRPVPVPGRM